ncbi:MAG: ATP-binding cassette domain-containing protein [Deltaproteobacteria bacterium]|nr:ATP-binding cassette domain-containing protein [Deltaproteobacteria bacterium]
MDGNSVDPPITLPVQAAPPPAPALELMGFGVAFGDSVVLHRVTLAVPPVGVTVLMGPGGAGKSTLVRTLAGANDSQPTLRTWGSVQYRGAPWRAGELPALVHQNARLMTASVFDNLALSLRGRPRLTRPQQRDAVVAALERFQMGELASRLDDSVLTLPLAVQRQVALARTALGDPALLCVDEPTAGLDDDARQRIIAMILREAEQRAVLLVTHHQREARAMGGQTALLAGGVLQECASTQAFFESPQSEAGRKFVAWGSCAVPAPEDARVPPPGASAGSAAPRGFHWIRRGLLAGLPRPGLLSDTEEDLAALGALGIRVLVCLEEQRTVPEPLLSRVGIVGLFLPITDMRAPDVADAWGMCSLVHHEMARGHAVAYHCRAGLGRTGTLLAAQLIFSGQTALEALEAVRHVQARFVQSPEQVDFLSAFERHARHKSAGDTRNS